MKNIEKSFANFVKGKGPKVSEEEICTFAKKDENSADELIDILFNVINSELDTVTGLESLERVRELFKCVNIVLNTNDNVNRKIVARKINRLDERLDRIKLENKDKFKDKTKAYKELELVRSGLEEVDYITTESETKQYEFVDFLIEEDKDVTHLEYAFKKLPGLVNVKDKEEVSLFRNIVRKYIDSIEIEDDEDTLYFSNLISLILSQNSFNLTTQEKRKTLDLIYSTIDKMSIKKKLAKKNREKIEWLNTLVNSIKGEAKNETKLELIANKYNISIHFSEDLIEKAKLIRVNDDSSRMIVDDYIITIDKENAIEVDDALSCRRLDNGNYLLGVHIASVLGYFDYESDIVREAIGRTRSIYLPNKYQNREDDFNRTIPIFPYEFSAKTGSLIEGSPKYARSYFFEIDREGNVVEELFKKTIITSNRKTTYHEVDKILEKGSDNEQLQEVVMNLQEVSDLLDKNYHGEIIYEKLKASVDDYFDLRVKRDGSEKLVYQPMVLTGSRVATAFYEKGYPCLYRVHEVNREDSKKLQAMIDNLTKTYGGDEYKKLYQLIDGLYPKGWYDTSGAHSGLGLDHHCHCTSELRRASDIVVEHALEVCFDKNPTDQELMALEEEINNKKVIINSKQDPIEWFVKDYKRSYQKHR